MRKLHHCFLNGPRVSSLHLRSFVPDVLTRPQVQHSASSFGSSPGKKPNSHCNETAGRTRANLSTSASIPAQISHCQSNISRLPARQWTESGLPTTLRAPQPLSASRTHHVSTSAHRSFSRTGAMATEQPKMDSEERPVHSRCNKQIEVRACGKLYSELAWSDPIMYFRAPQESGILFKVDYYDSVDMLGSHAKSAPTVCILHGAPGNYEEFSSLINSLTIRGLRVVAPNFPDYNATYQHSFRHSARERLDFLLELFKAIDVTQIDMLIGHSSAVYTMFELLDHSLSADRTKWPTTSDDFHIQIKSLGLFSTPSHGLPKNLERTTLKMISLKLWDYAWLKPLLLAGTGWIVKLLGIKNRVEYDKIENLLIASSAMGLSDYPKMGQRLSLLKEQRIPVLFVYGTKDRLIPVDKFEELERDLGVDDQSCVKQFRSDGSLVRDRTASEKLVQVSRFEEGGHYVFRKYSKQVNDDVCEFLQHKVQRNDKSDNSQL